MRIVYLSEQRVTRVVRFECTWFLCLVLSRLDDRSYLLHGLLVSAGRNELIDIYIYIYIKETILCVLVKIEKWKNFKTSVSKCWIFLLLLPLKLSKWIIICMNNLQEYCRACFYSINNNTVNFVSNQLIKFFLRNFKKFVTC